MDITVSYDQLPDGSHQPYAQVNQIPVWRSRFAYPSSSEALRAGQLNLAAALRELFGPHDTNVGGAGREVR
jgi:hypothetical protein